MYLNKIRIKFSSRLCQQFVIKYLDIMLKFTFLIFANQKQAITKLFAMQIIILINVFVHTKLYFKTLFLPLQQRRGLYAVYTYTPKTFNIKYIDVARVRN